jgi:hypothetical protein
MEVSMRMYLIALVMTLLSTAAASAQEFQGARRFELAGFPGGAIVFGENADEDGPNFGDYALGAAFAYNVNRWVGFEGEFGGGIGFRQDLELAATTLLDQKTPNLLAYSGNIIVHVVGRDRTLVPYAAGGVGGLTVFSNEEVALGLGLFHNRTHLTGNVGGGVKWFPLPHVGLRGDGRVVVIRNGNPATPLFGGDNRYGFRVYGGVVFTY